MFLTMTQMPALPTSRREAWKLALTVTLRLTVSIGLLLAAYYLIPTSSSEDNSDLPWLVLELVVFGVVVGIQVPAILRSKYPIMRAIEALAVTIALFLLIFARIYLSNSLGDPAAFTQQLDHTTALYFTVTVFTTVGFGDIVATTNSMKLLVTVQMLLNLVVIGLVIRLITSTAKRATEHRHQGPTPGS